ncbi:MAG: hypothetical protein IJD92_03655 [Bacilli bacterium]|nr:hypothetical protein [Bacilli bacterium]
MKWFKDNKQLLYKYLLVLIFNIILHILCNYYFKNSEYVSIYLLFAVLISNLIIYYIKGIVRYKYYLDIILNVILGFIIILFTKDFYIYSTSLFSIVLANNIIFMRSRLSEKLLKKTLQYLLILLISILCVSINFLYFLI